MILLLGSIIVAVWFVIYPGTDFYVRIVMPEVIRRGRVNESKICLTFDDGPDPEVTPQLLTVLKKMQVPAVFFLIGAKAERYPELVKTIAAEGHGIGLHTFDHRHAYQLFFGKSLSTILKGKNVIEGIIGKPAVWFRSPWGATNLFQYIMIKRLHLQSVLWSADAHDWKKSTGPQGVVQRLMKRVQPGAIIVLHDSGGEPGAPLNTLRALPDIVRNLRSQGLQFASLEDILGRHSHERSYHNETDRTGYR